MVVILWFQNSAEVASCGHILIFLTASLACLTLGLYAGTSITTRWSELPIWWRGAVLHESKTILNLSFSGILVSMLKREKRKVQDVTSQLAQLHNQNPSTCSSSRSPTSLQVEESEKCDTSIDYTHAHHLITRKRGELPLTRYL